MVQNYFREQDKKYFLPSARKQTLLGEHERFQLPKEELFKEQLPEMQEAVPDGPQALFRLRFHFANCPQSTRGPRGQARAPRSPT